SSSTVPRFSRSTEARRALLGLSSGRMDVPTRQLADGNEIPLLGLGVWQIPDGPECVNAVRWALEAGYRHIDTAQAYGNEESVGRAPRESGGASSSPRSSTRAGAIPPPRRSRACAAWVSTRSTCTSCTGRRVVPPGRG